MGILNILKTRSAKKSKRGLYLQDSELTQTEFKPGEEYSYFVDTEAKKITILPGSQNNDKVNHVSKRERSGKTIPVIDIRNQKDLAVFKDSRYLQVTICQDQVIVEGFAEDTEAKTQEKPEAVEAKGQVIDICNQLNIKRTATAWMSIQDLAQVVGLQTGSTQATGLGIIKPFELAMSAVSLFSGAGVMDQGFINAGFTIQYASDFDEGACQTYRFNHGNHIHCEDITKIDLTKLPQTPVMFGGSPCQGFSSANRRTHFLDNPKNLLVRKFIEAVKANKDCQVFCLENVQQILTAGGGQFRNEIYEELKDFEITSGVVSALDMGAPQDRKRAIFIGSKIGKIELPKPVLTLYRTVRDAFKGLNASIPNQLDYSKPSDLSIERMSYVPQGGNFKDIPEALRSKGQHSDYYKRLEWDKPSMTIVNPRKAVIIHPEENRILSIRECARLFGLPDSFIFKGGLSSMQQQVANAVPVPLAYQVAMAVKKQIQAFNQHQLHASSAGC